MLYVPCGTNGREIGLVDTHVEMKVGSTQGVSMYPEPEVWYSCSYIGRTSNPKCIDVFVFSSEFRYS